MQITYFGHSSFLVNTGETKILFDPFITPNELSKNIDIQKIECDLILISHAHGDHIHDVEAIAKNTKALVIANFEIITYFEKLGLSHTRPMNSGGSFQFNDIVIKMVKAEHSSSFPDGTYGGSANGFIIERSDKCFYYAGDTALFTDMNLFCENNSINFAFLPIGDNFTMDINAAIRASEMLQTETIIGMHYDTFGYIKINKEEAIFAAERSNKKLLLIDIESTINI